MLDFLMNNAALVLAAITSGFLLLWPSLRNGGGLQGVSVAEAVRLINREKGVLVDVNDAATFAAGHATGSRHLPLESVANPPTGVLPGNKALPVLVMCTRGQKAAGAAAALRKAGYERAVAVQGGLNAWREAQMPTEKSA